MEGSAWCTTCHHPVFTIQSPLITLPQLCLSVPLSCCLLPAWLPFSLGFCFSPPSISLLHPYSSSPSPPLSNLGISCSHCDANRDLPRPIPPLYIRKKNERTSKLPGVRDSHMPDDCAGQRLEKSEPLGFSWCLPLLLPSLLHSGLSLVLGTPP